MESMAVELQKVKDRCARNEGRIEKLEREHTALHELAKSVAVMAEQLKTMSDNVDTLADKVGELEAKPAKRWDGAVDKVLMAVLAALVGFVLAQLGL